MLRRRNGESVFTQHNTARYTTTRYTTTRTLRCEHDLLTHARRHGGHSVPEPHLQSALRGARLNAGQRDMVRSFAQSTRRLQLALAPAGAGKTTAMRVLANAWRNSGGRVFAFAPSARAAQELGDTIGARPHTLHQLTTAHAASDAARIFGFRPGDLVVIDEAAMAGTHTLHQVVTYALDHGADVRLVGDNHQLGAVEAGGAVTLIARDVGADRLHEIVRFTDAAEAHASLRIRDGNPHGLDHYLNHGRARGGSRETMRNAAHRRWRADLDEGLHALLIVPTHDDVVALNLQARAQRIRRGAVDDHSSIALADGTRASTGDHIVTRRNQRRLTVGRDDFVKNGDTWRVTAVHADGSITAEGHPGRVVLPAPYVAAHVELAYAATVHRVQGMTSDTAHILVPDTMSRQQLYTGITRGRHSNHLYVVTHHHVADQHQETPPARTAREVFTGVLDRSGTETSATEMLLRTLHETDSLATLVLRYNHAARYGDTDRYLDTIRRHVPTVVHRPAEPALIQTLRNAFDLGWHLDHLLTNPYLVDGLHEGRDPAALLSWRIDQHITHHTPPPPAVEPNPPDITRWRRLMTTAAPHTDTREDEWNKVWQAAARGKHDGLNPDAAIIDAAGRLAARTENPHLPDDRYTAAVIAAALADQQHRGHGYQPALPWLARIDFTTIDQHDGLRDYLRELNTTIATRTAELRDTTTREQPPWTAGLGARPTNTELASRWDRLAGLATAYRETHHITDTDPQSPLGKKPDSAGLRTRAWEQLTNEWRPNVTTPNDPTGRRAANQSAINALRDQIAELREDSRDFALDRHDDRRRADDVRRQSAVNSRDTDEHIEPDGREDRHTGLGY